MAESRRRAAGGGAVGEDLDGPHAWASELLLWDLGSTERKEKDHGTLRATQWEKYGGNIVQQC